MLFPITLQANTDHPISMKELPDVAHQFLSMHFPDTKIVSLMQDDDDTYDRDYTVILNNGTEIEFDLYGKWEEVKCHHTTVPDAIIPRQILEFIHENYPQSHVVKINREKEGYEARLESGCELEFDTHLMFRKAKKQVFTGKAVPTTKKSAPELFGCGFFTPNLFDFPIWINILATKNHLFIKFVSLS